MVFTSLPGFLRDCITTLTAPPDRVMSGRDLERGNKRVFFALTTFFALVAATSFAVLGLMTNSSPQTVASCAIIGTVMICSAWAAIMKTVEWPTRVIAVTTLLVLSVQTLRQGTGLHGAGWWLSVLPFVLAAGGYHYMACFTLAGFAAVVVVIYTFPDLNPFSGERMMVSAAIQMACILGSEVVAVALIAASTRRRTNITRALDLARSEALDAAAVKARFLANMSHEIRTPLLGLIGAIELMRSSSTSQSQRMQLVSLAESSAHSLHTLINDILDFSKLETGEVRLESAPFSVREVCFEVLELFAVKAFDRSLELTSTCDPAVPRSLLGDSLRLKQLLSNLVSNAVKFTAAGGVHVHITLDAQLTGPMYGAQQSRTWVLIEVSDTGIGIAADEIQTLFKPFVQADSTITRRFGGTGLGLSISSELATAMGGTLTVKSELGIGSTFYLRVPMAPGTPLHTHAPLEAGELSEACPQPKPTAQSPVVVASASLGLRRHIADLLRDLGHAHVLVDSKPSMDRLAGIRTLVLDAGLLIGENQVAAVVGTYAEPDRCVILLLPLGSDSIVGLFGVSSNICIVHKPVRLAALRRALDPPSRPDQPETSALVERPTLMAAAPATANDPRFDQLRILVAEDNPVNQVIIAAMLAELSAKCTMTSNGREAVDAYKAQPFDIVLMDLQMPEMDGIAATRAIRDHERAMSAGPVPVVAMTANNEQDVSRERREAGMAGFLAKPFRLSDLRQCLVSRYNSDTVGKNLHT